MAVTYESLMATRPLDKRFSYGERDCMLYAIGVGMGQDPMNRAELQFVYEKNLKAMPSMATVIAWDDSIIFDTGVDAPKVVHGEQRIALHRPLPTAAGIRSQVRIREVYDKGAKVGALLVTETRIDDAASGAPLCSNESVVLARGDGGFGGPVGAPSPLPKPPERAPDATVTFATQPNQALLYRLSGDRNPLHCDPDFAARGGFERPILHGLCTWGFACRAMLKACCDYDPKRLASFAARFTAPVFPGETLETEIWREPGGAHFRTRIVERNLLALNNGFAGLAA
jgi:acyl dehydratase